MNRRRFLSFLGLAPVAAAVPAMALPRAEKPTEVAKGTFRMTAETQGVHSANIGSVTAGTLRSADGKVICDLANHTIRFTV
ncbi:hypothetical protein BRY73_02890 [Ochrobactrum sp. P6BS-III]|uniref:twin-arginine translocation signal domain-containing protein n=1 Tax=unclassified Ochrobactrum TaxID=239106 RepID=UPI0009928FF6|nr:hypothetical protein [Ochrobactrum sp. P6BSIII]OOL20124.1 hypothetical protein BRY73_02890 [Ochrobactrum sp. P6BS-III]